MLLLNSLVVNYGESRVGFSNKLQTIATALHVAPEWLMLVFYIESGLNSQAVNKQNGDVSDAYIRSAKRATGLIQFMPDTARHLGTSTQALYKMSSIEQLEYVYTYYAPFSGRLQSFTDLYIATFFPAALGKSDTFILQTNTKSAALIAAQNPGYDQNKDKQITLGELKKAILKRVPSAYLHIALKKKD